MFQLATYVGETPWLRVSFKSGSNGSMALKACPAAKDARERNRKLLTKFIAKMDVFHFKAANE